jgi:hypothetical protein
MPGLMALITSTSGSAEVSSVPDRDLVEQRRDEV